VVSKMQRQTWHHSDGTHTYHFSQMFSNIEDLWSQPGFLITNDGKF